jgi:hypothetical protein
MPAGSDRFTEAVTALTEALDRYRRLNTPPWIVAVHRDLTQALRHRG